MKVYSANSGRPGFLALIAGAVGDYGPTVTARTARPTQAREKR
jgi:hypothetical protein